MKAESNCLQIGGIEDNRRVDALLTVRTVPEYKLTRLKVYRNQQAIWLKTQEMQTKRVKIMD